jgi:hypothetical protein
MKYIIAMLASLFFASPVLACEPGMEFQENLKGIDNAVKAGVFKQAIVFKNVNPNNPNEFVALMLTDAEGKVAVFHFVDGCVAPFSDGSMTQILAMDEELFALLGKSEIVFEGGNVKEFLKLKRFAPKEGVNG